VVERRVTLADVARRAGLSTTTASLVLNDRKDTRISSEAATRVRAAAAELGYRPNPVALMLSTSRSETIGFISDSVATTRYASALIHGALSEALVRRHILLIAETGGDPANELETLESLLSRYVDGIIFAFERSHEVELPRQGIPVPHVVLNASISGLEASILPDEFTAGKDVVRILGDAGIRNGVVLLGRQFNQVPDRLFTTTVRRRMEGIRVGLELQGLTLAAELGCTVWKPDAGYRAMTQFLSTGTPFEAIICLNDRLAFGAYQALAEYGLEVPRDVSIVSFDDDEISQYLRPQLTSVALPYEAMGVLAVELILSGRTQPFEHLVPMPVRFRGSVRPLFPSLNPPVGFESITEN